MYDRNMLVYFLLGYDTEFLRKKTFKFYTVIWKHYLGQMKTYTLHYAYMYITLLCGKFMQDSI